MDEAVFISFFTSVDHVRALGHGHGHVVGVVVWRVCLDWRFKSRCGAQRVALRLLGRLWSLYWYA